MTYKCICYGRIDLIFFKWKKIPFFGINGNVNKYFQIRITCWDLDFFRFIENYPSPYSQCHLLGFSAVALRLLGLPDNFFRRPLDKYCRRFHRAVGWCFLSVIIISVYHHHLCQFHLNHVLEVHSLPDLLTVLVHSRITCSMFRTIYFYKLPIQHTIRLPFLRCLVPHDIPMKMLPRQDSDAVCTNGRCNANFSVVAMRSTRASGTTAPEIPHLPARSPIGMPTIPRQKKWKRKIKSHLVTS